jgi:hypothetical protein
LLISKSILNIVNPNEDFVLCMDSCKKGLGGVITHNGHVVCYEFGKLKEHKNNYATHSLKHATIVHALKLWRHHLTGKK